MEREVVGRRRRVDESAPTDAQLPRRVRRYALGRASDPHRGRRTAPASSSSPPAPPPATGTFWIGFEDFCIHFTDVTFDRGRAVGFFELAAAGGSEYASLALAYRHAFGVGQPEDCPAGGAMYERAALSAAASLDTRRRTSVEQTNPAEPDHAVLLSRAMPDRERVEGPRAVLALEFERMSAVDGDAKRPAAARRQRGFQFLDEGVDLVRVEAEGARGRDVRVSAQIARRPRRRARGDGDEAPRARHGDVDQAVPAAAAMLRHVAVVRCFRRKGWRWERLHFLETPWAALIVFLSREPTRTGADIFSGACSHRALIRKGGAARRN